jgi:hypothetical protein
VNPTGSAADQLHPGTRRNLLDDVSTMAVVVLVDQVEAQHIPGA